eukprot:Gb_35247 [translate_table: standard]
MIQVVCNKHQSLPSVEWRAQTIKVKILPVRRFEQLKALLRTCQPKLVKAEMEVILS